MPTKFKPSTTMSAYSVKSNDYPDNGPHYWSSGSDYIDYGSGRKLPSGAWPWKECVHETISERQPIVGTTEQTAQFKSDGKVVWMNSANIILNWNAPSLPTSDWDESVLVNLLDQLNLNCRDSVMLYANVVQAVPLLGGVMRLNKILSDVASHISKGMRRQPFTTVIKSLISADFIDRFVISPTIDDARKFADACNYVLRVIATARERNSHIFALDSGVKTTYLDKEETVDVDAAWAPRWQAAIRSTQYAESKAFMLLEARYAVDAVSPLKLWAARTGFSRPLESLWDLVPFSFVADYFARGQDFISALSNEMSDQEGLSGTITRIHDLWGTHKVVGESRAISAKRVGEPSYNYGYMTNQTCVDTPHEAYVRNVRFRRFRIPNPWRTLARLESQPEDWCRITLNPTAAQKRTIAELVIQAKL